MVLADISGYTKFVNETEIEHSLAILRELLDTMVSSVGGQLRVSQIEGDCILFIGGLTEDEVVDLLEQSFVVFRRRLRAMQENTTCQCKACQLIGILSLKYVVHRGTYTVQKIGNIEQLHGADVIVGFRLLKNSVPSKEYLLATMPVIERLSTDRRRRFEAHVESYEGIGQVAAAYEVLASFWEDAQARERRHVSAEDATFIISREIEAPASAVWAYMTSTAGMNALLGMPKVTMVSGARGGMVDGEFHCHHGPEAVTKMRIVRAEAPREVTLHCYPAGGGEPFDQTNIVEPLGPERSRLTIRCAKESKSGAAGVIDRFVFRLAMRYYMGKFTRNAVRLGPQMGAAQAA